jgi:hypothetical protein
MLIPRQSKAIKYLSLVHFIPPINIFLFEIFLDLDKKQSLMYPKVFFYYFSKLFRHIYLYFSSNRILVHTKKLDSQGKSFE